MPFFGGPGLLRGPPDLGSRELPEMRASGLRFGFWSGMSTRGIRSSGADSSLLALMSLRHLVLSFFVQSILVWMWGGYEDLNKIGQF